MIDLIFNLTKARILFTYCIFLTTLSFSSVQHPNVSGNHDHIGPKEPLEECELYSTIQRMEGVFALKLISKHNLSQDIINDIISYSNDIHGMKMKAINHQLQKKFGAEDKVSVEKGIFIQ